MLQVRAPPLPREPVIKHLSAHHWIEGRCDKHQMNSQAARTGDDEKQQKSHGAGVDREDFMEVVETEMGIGPV